MQAAATINATDMQKHLYTLAGPDLEGRDTPSARTRKSSGVDRKSFSSTRIAARQ
jgi:hypothetical protein